MLIKTNVKELQENVFNLIGKQWMLVTSGNMKSLNTMTASWGGLGVLWNRYVATIYIRPQRYTLDFLKKNEIFTLCFFDEQYKDILRYCGAHSGKDVDKIDFTGLETVETENGGILFRQSRLVFECRKIYHDQIDENKILDNTVPTLVYPDKDYHHLIIGEITNCLLDK